MFGSGIDFYPDPGSLTHVFESLVTILKIGPNFFLQHFKSKIIFNFVKFVAPEEGITTIFFHPSLLLLFLDPGSGVGKNQDPGSEINIPDPQH